MKIFWSWQSDHDKATGNYFVRDALKQAAKELGRELEISERIEVDHDTKGVPGRPPIVQTIFDKIEAARAFVADVTPVGETAAGKPLPNPNVMIELGYARRSRGHERLIFVANGQHLKKPEDLPFDLRGDRGPAMYTLAEGADAVSRFAVAPPEASFAPHGEAIDRCFGKDSIAAILAALDAEGTEWAAAQAKILRRMSPTSLCVSLELLRRGAKQDLAGCLATELALTRVVVNVHPDFAEGVRSVLVDKDGAPKWQPARIEDVDAAAIQRMFGG